MFPGRRTLKRQEFAGYGLRSRQSLSSRISLLQCAKFAWPACGLEQNGITLNRKGIPFVASISFKSVKAAMEARAMARPTSMDLWECAMERLDRGQTVRQVAVAGFERVRPKLTGRPGYDPAGLLKLCIYGYLNRIRSSRRLETETHRNLEVTCCCAGSIQISRRLPPSAHAGQGWKRIWPSQAYYSSEKTLLWEYVSMTGNSQSFHRQRLANASEQSISAVTWL